LARFLARKETFLQVKKNPLSLSSRVKEEKDDSSLLEKRTKPG
jgi:hypothetical protein